jgi:hypothetical protein
MPLRPAIKSEILQHQNGISRCDFRQHRLQLWLQWVDQQLVRSSSRNHFDLQATFALRKIYPLHKLLRLSSDATLGKHSGKRCRPALIVFLREEWHFIQFNPLRKS